MIDKYEKKQSRDQGGTQALRGFEFQKCGLVLYFLRRLQPHPDNQIRTARLIVETLEDGTIEYETTEGQEIVFTEFIQCKKIEDNNSELVLSGYGLDTVKVGKFTPVHLKDWLSSDREVTKLLSNSENVAYTALTLRNPADNLVFFQPFSINKAKELSVSYSFWSRSDFNECFLYNFKHYNDPADQIPNPKKRENFKKTYIPSENVRKNVRIVALPSWENMSNDCERLLRVERSIPPSRSYYALMELLKEYDKRALATNPSQKILTAGDVETLLSSYQTAPNNWFSAKEWLEYDINVLSSKFRRRPLRWFDFHSGSYVHRPEFDEAVHKLENDKFLVIHGYPGAGKTSLARYLAYSRILKDDQCECYVLQVHPDQSFDAEKEFFLSRLEHNALFIIDDEQFSSEKIQSLLRLYIDYSAGIQAHLVVTTIDTYSQRMYGKSEKQDNPLTQAAVIRLQLEEHKLINFLENMRTTCGLETPLQSQDIVKIANGRLGLALVVASASSETSSPPSVHTLLNRSIFGEFLKEWILQCIGISNTNQVFEEHLVPLFILREIGYFEVFPEGMKHLRRGGFLEQGKNDSALNLDFSLSWLIGRMYQDRIPHIMTTLLKANTSALPVICLQLAKRKSENKYLAMFLQKNQEKIIELLIDLGNPIPLSSVATILFSIFKGCRPECKDLFLKISKPNGNLNIHFFWNFLRFDRIDNLLAVSNFFKAILLIDRYLVRKLAEKGFGQEQADILWSRFCANLSKLDEVAMVLKEIFYCNHNAGIYLFKKLENSSLFQDQIKNLTQNLERYPTLLRFCTLLYYRNRKFITSILNEYFNCSCVVQYVLERPTQISALVFLLQLRQLRPRLVKDAVDVIWDKNQHILLEQYKNLSTLIEYSQIVGKMYNFNRRIARKIVLETKTHLAMLIRQETHYRNAAAELHNEIKRVTSRQFTQQMCQYINRESILQSMQNETLRMDFLGKSLTSWSELDPQLGNWLTNNLDIEHIASTVYDDYLVNLSYLLHGFLNAANKDGENRIRNAYRNGSLLPIEFKKAWEANDSLSQAALCIQLLSEVHISPADISALVGCANPKQLEKDVLELFHKERSMLQIATSLYFFTNYSHSLATTALEEYLSRFTKSFNSRSYNLKNNNLVELGSTLQVATAIDRIKALEFTKCIALKRFIRYANEETNLGRLAVFVSGLHSTSRALAREFVETISQEDVWKYQITENERINNLLHWAHALSFVSKSRSKYFVNYLIDNHIDEIYDYIEFEANLMQVSNWLRLFAVSDCEDMEFYIGKFVKVLDEVSEYDIQLIHLLEVTEAMIECGILESAHNFISIIKEQFWQIRTLSLRNFVLVFHKVQRIEKELNIEGFTVQMLDSIDEWHFQLLFLNDPVENLNDKSIVAAFAVYLLKTCGLLEMKQLNKVVNEIQKLLLDRAKGENHHPLFRAVIQILCNAPYNEIQQTALISTWITPWERGLAHILNHIVHRNENNLFVESIKGEIENYSKEISTGLSEHASNTEFGLCLQLVYKCDINDTLRNDLSTQANERASDENHGAIRWLLTEYPGQIPEDSSYYTWSLLHKTIFKATYLPWAQQVEESARKDAFNMTFKPDLEALLG